MARLSDVAGIRSERIKVVASGGWIVWAASDWRAENQASDCVAGLVENAYALLDAASRRLELVWILECPNAQFVVVPNREEAELLLHERIQATCRAGLFWRERRLFVARVRLEWNGFQRFFKNVHTVRHVGILTSRVVE
jgi:hypothetical protein